MTIILDNLNSAERSYSASHDGSGDGHGRTLAIFDPDLAGDGALVRELRALGVEVSIHHDPFNVIVEMATLPPSLLVISSVAWGAQAARIIAVARERFEVPVALAIERTDDPADFATAIVAGISPLLDRPYRVDALLAALRQTASRDLRDETLSIGDLVLNASALSAHYRGRRIGLSAKEFAALWMLGQRCGLGVRPLELGAVIWPDRGTTLASTRTLVRRLRVRLAEAQVRLSVTTVRGIGYRLEGCCVESCAVIAT